MKSKLQLACLIILITRAAFAAAPASDPATRPTHRTGPFILGADISWVDEDEANGTTFFDHDKQADVFQILKDHGFNFIRLRVFVNPASPIGYDAASKQPFCDADHTARMARRARAAGMGLLIDFHYSDTWADPGHQTKPAAWQNLDFPALQKAVYNHTHAVLAALQAQGTTPDMVQIGNEVTNGMLWPDGRVHVGDSADHFDNFAALLKSGIAAAHDVDPKIKIVLHNDKGKNNKPVRAWVDNLLAKGVHFDILGLSCNSDGPVADWEKNFDDLAARYPRLGLIAAEYSYKKRELNDVIHNAPDQRGLGSFIWEPTRHHEAIFSPHDSAATAVDAPPNGAPHHRPRTGRYDTNDRIDLYPQMSKDYANEN